MAVALALGIGTMIGWRRVAMTIGEKIGKRGMTYAQGMAAQMTAAVSIGLASYIGMPVSTTHVLSSAVAGTMVVDGGGLQRKTVTSILMFTGGNFSFWWAVLDSIAVDLTFLKMPGPGDRAFPFLTSDNHARS